MINLKKSMLGQSFINLGELLPNPLLYKNYSLPNIAYNENKCNVIILSQSII